MKVQKFGKDLKKGDIVWSNGYKFRVTETPKRDPHWGLNGKGRFCFTGEMLPQEEQINEIPETYRVMTLALREDLPWTVEV